MNISKNKNKICQLKFPYWHISIEYVLSLLMVSISILFIIARGIERGDLNTQKMVNICYY
jgi:low temperature requirement protein LtrA